MYMYMYLVPTRFYLWLWLSGPASPQVQQWLDTVGCRAGEPALYNFGDLLGDPSGGELTTAKPGQFAISRSMPIFYQATQARFVHCLFPKTSCASAWQAFQPAPGDSAYKAVDATELLGGH